MKAKLLFALMIAAAGFAGCNKSDTPGHPENNCPGEGHCGIAPGGCFPGATCEDVICTADFRAVNVELRQGLATVIRVDSFAVTDQADMPLPTGPGGTPVYGYPDEGAQRYTVINDSWVQGHQNASKAIRFKGYLNGAEVFNEPYVITADCCHVSKVSGKDVIDLQ